jgi:hypothetical protein
MDGHSQLQLQSMASVGTATKVLAFLATVILPFRVGTSVAANNSATPQLTPPPAPAPSTSDPASAPAEANAGAPVRKMFIGEYRVTGCKILTPAQIGETVYPFLGPDRTLDDVEKARAALEKAYHDKGYNTVQVDIPQQQGRGGVVFLQVVENKVGRLRVKGSRYFSLDAIRKSLPAIAPGTVPNFDDLNQQMIGVNQWADRRDTVGENPTRQPRTEQSLQPRHDGAAVEWLHQLQQPLATRAWRRFQLSNLPAEP